MKKILFVCHGNICRSPMAEYVMKSIVKDKQIAEVFEIASAGTSSEELGNPVYPPVKNLLSDHGIDCSDKRARQLNVLDYEQYDFLIGMDQANIQNMIRLYDGDPDQKISLLMSYTGYPGEVEDPWYTHDFNKTWAEVTIGCYGFLAHLNR